MNDDTTLRNHVDGVARGHRRLNAHLGEVESVCDPRRPSLLPGWSIGHVLTHLARNAESHTRMIESAVRGGPPVQYPGGPSQRASAIADGADRSMADLVADVRDAGAALDAAYADAPPEVWQMHGERFPGVPWGELSNLPFHRWREVEVHHSDLGIKGFTLEDWDDRYVREELTRQEMAWAARKPMGLTSLPATSLNLQPRTRLAWLLGRITPGGLEPVTFA